MGEVIDAAKAAAGDLFDGLVADFGDVAAGVGVFGEATRLGEAPANSNVIFGAGLSTDAPTFTNNINAVELNTPDPGFDVPESGYDAIALAGNNLNWRPGSNRFMFLFTDATAKGDLAAANAALANRDITLVTLGFDTTFGAGFAAVETDYGAPLSSIVRAAGLSAEAIIDEVTGGIVEGFAEYNEVTVSDLGAGLPEIDVAVSCTGADIGDCVDDTAVGQYDRSVERTFTFDVTFTRVAEGDTSFTTLALVDGGAVAREFDTFTTAAIPVPAALPLLLTAFGGLGLLARRRRAA